MKTVRSFSQFFFLPDLFPTSGSELSYLVGSYLVGLHPDRYSTFSYIMPVLFDIMMNK